MKEEADNLEDAMGMVEESFGEEIKLFLGECFVTVDEEQGQKAVEDLIEQKNDELEKKRDKLEQYEQTMKELKTYLYAKFGQSINLEEHED